MPLDGGTRGAPDAVQVADRWHLLHNLGEAAEKTVARHRQHLPAALAAAKPPDLPAIGPAAPPAPRGDRTAMRTRRRHTAVHTMLADGRSVRAIAPGLSRNTVRRFARADDPEELLLHDGTGRRPGILETYEPYLRERWHAGATQRHAAVARDPCPRLPGGYSHVRDYLAPFRQTAAMPGTPPRPPKPHKVDSWIMTRPGALPAGDQAGLDAILAASPELAALAQHVRAFATLMTERRGRDLEAWMTAATSGEPSLQSFLTGLRARPRRRTAGLTLRWSPAA